MIVVIGWLIGILLVTVILIVLASKLEVRIHLTRRDADDDWSVKFRWLYGLVRYTIKIPAVRWKDGEGLELKKREVSKGKVQAKNKPVIDSHFIKKEYRKLLDLLHNTFGLSRWIKETLKHVRCRELVWHTQLGAGGAVETATIIGLVWSLKGSIVALLSNYIKLAVQPRLQIIPHFNESRLDTVFSCIFNIRTGYAIVAGMLLLIRIVRIKGGMKVWRSTLSRAS